MFSMTVHAQDSSSLVWSQCCKWHLQGSLKEEHTFSCNQSRTKTLAWGLQVCRGLFQAHRLIFSFLICTSIQQQARHITSAEWSYVLRGVQPTPTTRPNPAPTVLTPASWGGLHALEEALPVFKGIVRSFALDGQAWIQWLQSPEPHLLDLPVSWQSEVSFLCFEMSPQILTQCICLCISVCVSLCVQVSVSVHACICLCLQTPPPRWLPCCHTRQALPLCCVPNTSVFSLPSFSDVMALIPQPLRDGHVVAACPAVHTGHNGSEPNAEAVPSEAGEARVLGSSHSAVCHHKPGTPLCRAWPSVTEMCQEGQQ